MKALRYLLMVMTVAIVSVTVQAQSTAQFKTSENKVAFDHSVGKTNYEFYSTSTLKGSGSSLPIAARNGVTIGANTPDDNTRAYAPGRPKRDVGGGGSVEGDPEPDDPEEPYPVGDGVWVMLLMAAMYAFGKWRYQMSLGGIKRAIASAFPQNQSHD